MVAFFLPLPLNLVLYRVFHPGAALHLPHTPEHYRIGTVRYAMSDAAQSTVTPVPDINAGLGVDVPETEWLSVSSTGLQRLARFGGDASAPR